MVHIKDDFTGRNAAISVHFSQWVNMNTFDQLTMNNVCRNKSNEKNLCSGINQRFHAGCLNTYLVVPNLGVD